MYRSSFADAKEYAIHHLIYEGHVFPTHTKASKCIQPSQKMPLFTGDFDGITRHQHNEYIFEAKRWRQNIKTKLRDASDKRCEYTALQSMELIILLVNSQFSAIELNFPSFYLFLFIQFRMESIFCCCCHRRMDRSFDDTSC